MNEFIDKFKNQLEDTSLNLNPQTDYINSDFWDSLTAVTIQMMIEDEYKVDIAIDELAKFKSIEELYNSIQSKK
ncbi:acyl carrier protein [Apibacter raozihei]|uniref:acyl carrier protein n=1 Tax=Apibacter TaxID=1778601 RepID=UPI000FE2FAD4|nr:MULTISPECIES: acyl carrier protein [Apibacter]